MITKITHISSMRGRLDLGFGLYGGRQFVHLPESPAPSPPPPRAEDRGDFLHHFIVQSPE